MKRSISGVRASALMQLQNVVIGCRIPKDYFVTKGKGESDIAVHAGSYHLALKDAGIEKFNIMTYSSILPGIATEIQRPTDGIHGSVMETICAVATSPQGQRATASIIYGWLFDKETGQRYGGLVCEQNGSISKEDIESQLRLSLNELYVNGFSEKYDLKNIRITTESFVPQKKFGTSIVAICFTNYVVPVQRDA